MGKYGNGISFGTVCTLERVEIRKALEGKVLDYYDDEGERVYREGTKEEIEKVVISAYDALVYQAFQVRLISVRLNVYIERIVPEAFEFSTVYAFSERKRK